MSSDFGIELITGSAAETVQVGTAIASWVEPGDVLLLHGDLGAGKTTMAKGIADGLRVSGVVSSPTFALANEYPLPPDSRAGQLNHIDLYRIEEGELDSMGFVELAASTTAVTIVEWPERAGQHLPERYLLIEIEPVGGENRRIRISGFPRDEIWSNRLAGLANQLSSRGTA